MPFSSYNGWPASSDRDAIGIVDFEPLPGVKFPGGIKGGDVEVVMTELVRRLDAEVEPAELYEAGDEWGWAFRANVNDPDPDADDMSTHASGTGLDYNATRHPNRIPYTWEPWQVRAIHRILDDLGGIIRWLEGYDEMHFEIRGSAAQVKAVADKIRKRGGSKPTIPVPALIVMEDLPVIVRRIENTKQCVLVVQDKTTALGVRGFFAEREEKPDGTAVKGKEGIFYKDPGNEIMADQSAWSIIYDNWLLKNNAVLIA